MVIPFILYAFAKNKKVGAWLSFGIFAVITVWTMVYIMLRNIKGNIKDQYWNTQYYYQGQFRGQVYFLGAAVALFNMIRVENLQAKKQKADEKKKQA